MKKVQIIVLLALAVLGSFSCNGKKRVKITDPVQQQALRTRDESIPIDSLFTGQAVKKIASPFKRIAIGKMFADGKVAYRESAEKGAREKYAEKLRKKDNMKKEDAAKAAEKADSTTLADYKAGFFKRMEISSHSMPKEEYSPSLTLYFLLVLIAFVIIFSIRVYKAFFVSPK